MTMPISATGNSRHPASAGFTLVELLAVLVVIGLAAATVVLTMPDQRGALRAEAERFAARAHTARNEAIVEARPVALVVDSGGYAFERYGQGRWQVITEPPLDRHAWPNGVIVQVEGATDGRIAFDEMGSTDGALVTLAHDGNQVRVRIGGDGAIDAEA